MATPTTGTAPNYGKGLTGLMKRGWHEIPGVMGSSVMALIGIGLAGAALIKYVNMDHHEPKFKHDFIIYRSDDPRAANTLKDRQKRSN